MSKLLLALCALTFLTAFSNADYSGRYVCNVTSNDAVNSTAPEYFTGIVNLNPNGGGGYGPGGVLKAAASAIAGVTFDDTLPPSQNYCLYTLDTSSSSYSVGPGGGGIEFLQWTAVGSNIAACPPTFGQNEEFQIATNGKNPLTSNNLLATNAAGQGYCIKSPGQSFTAASYSGRHVCSGGNDFNSVTGITRTTPDGAGHYTAGSLNSAIASFGAFSGIYCNYSLDTTNSSYFVNPNGTGFETLAWVASSANDPVSCPAAGTTFTDQTAIALGANSTVEYSSANFLNQNLAGGGHCSP